MHPYELDLYEVSRTHGDRPYRPFDLTSFVIEAMRERTGKCERCEKPMSAMEAECGEDGKRYHGLCLIMKKYEEEESTANLCSWCFEDLGSDAVPYDGGLHHAKCAAERERIDAELEFSGSDE